MSYKVKQNFSVIGLYTDGNEYSTPDGALAKADNITITEPNVVRSRRGFVDFGDALPNIIRQIFEFDDGLFAYIDGDVLMYNIGGSPNWASYITTLSPVNGYLYTQEAQGELFITTATGVHVIDTPTNEPVLAGGVKATGGDTAEYSVGVFLDNDAQCAYRILWGYKNANDRNIYGVPSDRLVYRNTSGAAVGVTLTMDIPDNITTAHFYQLYRSEQVAITGEPDDELRLVYEGNPTAGDLTNGYITINDDTDDSNRGSDLYTNVSQRGPEKGYYPPPLCKDICWWQNRMFFGNTEIWHQAQINLVSVGPPIGLEVGDTITIGGIVYTAGLVESVAGSPARIFAVPGGSPLVVPSYALESVAQSLIRVINRSDDSVVNAYYLSGFDDFPGQILLEAKQAGGSAFSVGSSNGSAFSPSLTTALTSTNEVKTNRVYYSLEGQPEAVPLLNYFDVGSTKDDIIRLYAQQDYLYAFTTSGIYRIASSGDSYTDVRISTAKLVAPRSLGVIRNSILCYTTQGIVLVSSTGIDDTVSGAIERTLLRLTDDNSYTNFATLTNAVGYETERLYIVSTVFDTDDIETTQMYVYNTVHGGWSKWLRTADSMLVRQTDNKLYITDGAQIYVERKNFLDTDYADNEYDVVITGVSDYLVGVSDSTNLAVGQKLIQGDVEGVITSVDHILSTITFEYILPWEVNIGSPRIAATAYDPIECVIKVSKEHCGDPSALKHYAYFINYFSDQTVTDKLTYGLSTDQFGSTTMVYDIPEAFGVLGNFVLGLEDLGGALADALPITLIIPRTASVGRWIDLEITHKEAQRSFGFSGYVLLYNNVSRRSK